VKNTRLPVDAILANADDYTPEEIATEILQGITPEIARRIINFARRHASHPV
jgi:ATP-dependent Clp protease adapter protein ClpS